jgi:hypothetical protein
MSNQRVIFPDLSEESRTEPRIIRGKGVGRRQVRGRNPLTGSPIYARNAR